MKQIPLLQGKALLIELPEGATDIRLHGPDNMGDTALICNLGAYYCLPKGNWRIIGMLSEVTEEMATTVVKECIDACERTTGYANYNRGDKPKPFCLDTALESLESAIEAAGYTFENKERCPQLSDYDDNCFGVTSWDDMPLEDQFQREKWETAQSRVLDRSRCLLLGREQ